jgi:hypothetical protein
MLRAIGLTEAQVDGDQKGIPCDLLGGLTPRYAMQTLGTEWGRECMGPDFWASIWKDRVKQKLKFGRNVVVDDCRFENEDRMVRELGGVHIQLSRHPHPSGRVHVSEMYKVPATGGVIPNLGPKDQLFAGIRGLLALAASSDLS